jgi:hypothetical protein
MRQVVTLGDLVGRLERLEIRCRRCERRGLIRLARLIEAYLAGTTSYRGLRVFMAVHRERLNAVFSTALRRAPAVNPLRALLPVLPAAMCPRREVPWRGVTGRQCGIDGAATIGRERTASPPAAPGRVAHPLSGCLSAAARRR